ncbi:hypothetical protein SAY87_027033 [Trapa incisa]|uniref:Uncharacterized protein n=2 Tax=Trapa TaxID=22665 RepID=A0AAN7M7W1_TRANT|nr:hypothetical protein SAY87_027033 [Trapa incisa]KAK4799799.1 hypothetical protein SAY86_025164 [Trapa natans]
MAALLSSHLFINLSPSSPFLVSPSPHFASRVKLSSRSGKPNWSKSLILPFALTESDSPKSIEPNSQSLLQELAKSFDLPSDYFAQLPRDLRLDLNDAAFDLSNGPVIEECGEELGEILLSLSKAWEKTDTSTSRALASKLPLLESSLTDGSKSAFGRRLVSAGRRFQGMGQYGKGELAKVSHGLGSFFPSLSFRLSLGIPFIAKGNILEQQLFKFSTSS